MRPHGSQSDLEKRRGRAIALLKQGSTSLSEVARQVGASKSSASRWHQAYQESGSKALRYREILGRSPKLSSEQKVQLEQVLLAGPLAAGYRTDLWTEVGRAKSLKKTSPCLLNHLLTVSKLCRHEIIVVVVWCP